MAGEEIIIPIKIPVELDLSNSTKALESFRSEARTIIDSIKTSAASANTPEQVTELSRQAGRASTSLRAAPAFVEAEPGISDRTKNTIYGASNTAIRTIELTIQRAIASLPKEALGVSNRNELATAQRNLLEVFHQSIETSLRSEIASIKQSLTGATGAGHLAQSASLQGALTELQGRLDSYVRERLGDPELYGPSFPLSPPKKNRRALQSRLTEFRGATAEETIEKNGATDEIAVKIAEKRNKIKAQLKRGIITAEEAASALLEIEGEVAQAIEDVAKRQKKYTGGKGKNHGQGQEELTATPEQTPQIQKYGQVEVERIIAAARTTKGPAFSENVRNATDAIAGLELQKAQIPKSTGTFRNQRDAITAQIKAIEDAIKEGAITGLKVGEQESESLIRLIRSGVNAQITSVIEASRSGQKPLPIGVEPDLEGTLTHYPKLAEDDPLILAERARRKAREASLASFTAQARTIDTPGPIIPIEATGQPRAVEAPSLASIDRDGITAELSRGKFIVKSTNDYLEAIRARVKQFLAAYAAQDKTGIEGIRAAADAVGLTSKQVETLKLKERLIDAGQGSKAGPERTPQEIGEILSDPTRVEKLEDLYLREKRSSLSKAQLSNKTADAVIAAQFQILTAEQLEADVTKKATTIARQESKKPAGRKNFSDVEVLQANILTDANLTATDIIQSTPEARGELAKRYKVSTADKTVEQVASEIASKMKVLQDAQKAYDAVAAELAEIDAERVKVRHKIKALKFSTIDVAVAEREALIEQREALNDEAGRISGRLNTRKKKLREAFDGIIRPVGLVEREATAGDPIDTPRTAHAKALTAAAISPVDSLRGQLDSEINTMAVRFKAGQGKIDPIGAAVKVYFANVEKEIDIIDLEMLKAFQEVTKGYKGISSEKLDTGIHEERNKRYEKATADAKASADAAEALRLKGLKGLPKEKESLEDLKARGDRLNKIQEGYQEPPGGQGGGRGGGGRSGGGSGPPPGGPSDPDDLEARRQAQGRVNSSRFNRLVSLYEQNEHTDADARTEAIKNVGASRINRATSIYEAEAFTPEDAAASARQSVLNARNKGRTGVATEEALVGTSEGIKSRTLALRENILRAQRVAAEQSQLSEIQAGSSGAEIKRRGDELQTQINKALEKQLSEAERAKFIATDKGQSFVTGEAARLDSTQRERLQIENQRLSIAKETGTFEAQLRNEALRLEESLAKRVAASRAILEPESQIAKLTAEQQVLQRRANQAIAKQAQEIVKQQVASGEINKGTLFQKLNAASQSRKGNVQLPDEGPTLGKFVGQKFATTAGFLVSGSLLYGGFAQLKTAVDEAEKLQVELGKLQTTFVATDNAAGFPAFRDALLAISRDTGVAGSEVVDVGLQLKGAFKSATVAADETRAAIELAKVSGLDLKEITNNLTATAVTYGTTIRHIGNISLALQESTGVLAKETIDFLGQIAPTAKEAGLSLEQIAAVAAVAQERSGRAGGAIAEGFNRVLPAIEGNGSKIIDLFSKLSKPPVIKFPGADGKLETRTVTSELVQQQLQAGQTGQVLVELAASYSQLDPALQKTFVSMVGGRREAQNLLAVFSDYPSVLRAYQHEFDSSGKLTDYFAQQQKTIQVTMDRVRAAFAQVGEALLRGGLGDALQVIGADFIGLLSIMRAGLSVFAAVNEATGGWAGRLVGLLLAMRLLAPAVQLVFKATGLLTGAKTLGSIAALAHASAEKKDAVATGLAGDAAAVATVETEGLALAQGSGAATSSFWGPVGGAARGAETGVVAGAVTKTGLFGKLTGLGAAADGSAAIEGGLLGRLGFGSLTGGAAIGASLAVTAGLVVAVAGIGAAVTEFGNKAKENSKLAEKFAQYSDATLKEKVRVGDDRNIYDKIFGGKSTEQIAQGEINKRAAAKVEPIFGSIIDTIPKEDPHAKKAVADLQAKVGKSDLGVDPKNAAKTTSALLDLISSNTGTTSDFQAILGTPVPGHRAKESPFYDFINENKDKVDPYAKTLSQQIHAIRNSTAIVQTGPGRGKFVKDEFKALLPKSLQALSDDELAGLISNREAFRDILVKYRGKTREAIIAFKNAADKAEKIHLDSQTDAAIIAGYQLRDPKFSSRSGYIAALERDAKRLAEIASHRNTNETIQKQNEAAAVAGYQAVDQALGQDASDLSTHAQILSQIRGENTQQATQRQLQAAIQSIKAYGSSANPDPHQTEALYEQYLTAAQNSLEAGGSIKIPKRIQQLDLDAQFKRLGGNWKDFGKAFSESAIQVENAAVDLGDASGQGAGAGLRELVSKRIDSLRTKISRLKSAEHGHHLGGDDLLAVRKAVDETNKALEVLTGIQDIIGGITGIDKVKATLQKEVDLNKSKIDVRVAGSKNNVDIAQAAIDKAKQDKRLYGPNTAQWNAADAAEKAAEVQRADAINSNANSLFDVTAAYQSRDAGARTQTVLQQAIQKYNQLKSQNADASQLNAAKVAIINAQFAAEDAMNAIADSHYDIAIALDNLHGDKLGAAKDTLDKAKAAYDRAKQNGSGAAELAPLYVAYLGAQRASRDALISDKESEIDFQLHVKKISTSQAVAQYSLLLREAQILQLGKDTIEGLKTKLYDLKHSLTQDLQFNLPSDLNLPTLYEARRFNQSGGAGGYQDNRRVSIVITTNHKLNPKETVKTITDALNAPPRYGTRPGAY